MTTKVQLDNKQPKDRFLHNYNARQSDEIAFHIGRRNLPSVKHITGRRICIPSFESSRKSKRVVHQSPFKHEPFDDSSCSSGTHEASVLPYPTFSSPLEDISFRGFEEYVFENQPLRDASLSNKIKRISIARNGHSRSNSLFELWGSDYVVRPPSSPVGGGKRKWFRTRIPSGE